MAEAASIRYNNPGAQWDGPIAKKWGSEQHVILADGQANHIAIFDTKVHGACAEFDLWRNNYSNMTLQGAVAKWSGGNSPTAYMDELTRKSGVSAGEIITPALLASARGLALMKAQAQWEAGKPYPMSDGEWQQAQAAVFKGGSSGTKPVIASGGVTGGTVIAAQQAHAAGYHWGAVIGILAVGLIIAAVVYIIVTKNQSSAPPSAPVIPVPPGPARGPLRQLPAGSA